MSKSTLWEKKYVLMAISALIFLVAGSVIVDFNYLDAAYLLFIVTCIIRYILICKSNRN